MMLKRMLVICGVVLCVGGAAYGGALLGAERVATPTERLGTVRPQPTPTPTAQAVATPTPTAQAEDDPGWDCRTMGNKACSKAELAEGECIPGNGELCPSVPSHHRPTPTPKRAGVDRALVAACKAMYAAGASVPEMGAAGCAPSGKPLWLG